MSAALSGLGLPGSATRPTRQAQVSTALAAAMCPSRQDLTRACPGGQPAACGSAAAEPLGALFSGRCPGGGVVPGSGDHVAQQRQQLAVQAGRSRDRRSRSRGVGAAVEVGDLRPDSRAITTPAAMSQLRLPRVTEASKPPSATMTRSMADVPIILVRCACVASRRRTPHIATSRSSSPRPSVKEPIATIASASVAVLAGWIRWPLRQAPRPAAAQ